MVPSFSGGADPDVPVSCGVLATPHLRNVAFSLQDGTLSFSRGTFPPAFPCIPFERVRQETFPTDYLHPRSARSTLLTLWSISPCNIVKLLKLNFFLLNQKCWPTHVIIGVQGLGSLLQLFLFLYSLAFCSPGRNKGGYDPWTLHLSMFVTVSWIKIKLWIHWIWTLTHVHVNPCE